MYRNIADYTNILFNGNDSSYNFMMPAILFVILFMLLGTDIFAQWINNPTLNTELVTEASDPINILSVRDLNGGAFVFWQDNRNGFQNEVYYIRMDAGGKINQLTGQNNLNAVQTDFKHDIRKVTSMSGSEENPVCSYDISNSAIVVWTDYTYSKTGYLFAQRILGNGNPGWTDRGLQISSSDDEISGYSLCSDNSGSSYVAFISKESAINGDYKVEVQKISLDGKILFDPNAVLISKSRNRKSMTSVVPDNEGGVYVFWIETQNNKSIILGQHIDSEGKAGWENNNQSQHDRMLEISNPSQNVMTYAAKIADGKSIYIAWQTQKGSKDIYHQLIDNKGKILWGRGGKQITSIKGNQFNPQIICADSTIILSWTNEQSNNSDIYIQKYNANGKPVWNKTGVPVIKYKGEQFGQRLVSDGKGGAILSWIDTRNSSALADIYAQRVNSDGELVWDPLGVPVATNHNTPKSYISLIADDAGGAVVIFKNSRNSKNKIYGQKIFSTGDYISQIEDLTTSITGGDSVKISWNSRVGQNSVKFNVERAVQTQDGNTEWHSLGTVNSLDKNNVLNYEYFDMPTVTGTLFYRITQTDSKGNAQRSDVSHINYFRGSSEIIVTQNIPNPFVDSTVISFYLPNPAMVEIEFFNDHVEKISELDKSFPAGERSITFYSKGLKPGIYFYRLKVNDFVDVKKMIITN
ncbi:MAG: hypothetical protein P4L45_08120 [Ignavibacteriaceae bacterium]|nr:hypothetical protein [Ignavibacteriaceae bacterium]